MKKLHLKWLMAQEQRWWAGNWFPFISRVAVEVPKSLQVTVSLYIKWNNDTNEGKIEVIQMKAPGKLQEHCPA